VQRVLQRFADEPQRETIAILGNLEILLAYLIRPRNEDLAVPGTSSLASHVRPPGLCRTKAAEAGGRWDAS
jgi:hypothetical protein